jgi:hypothetical protein
MLALAPLIAGCILVVGATSQRTVVPPAAAQVAPVEAPAMAVVGPAGLVPESAIRYLDGAPMVFVVERDLHLFVATPVAIADRAGSDGRHVAGVSSGQTVLAGAFDGVERRLDP